MSIDLAKTFMTETRMCDGSLYADGFRTTFPDGSQLPGDVVRSFAQALVDAAPDFSFNVVGWSQEGDVVTGEARVSATMTRALEHPQVGTIPPTGKKAELGIERFTLRFEHGKVASMVVVSDAPGGPPEVIRQWTA